MLRSALLVVAAVLMVHPGTILEGHLMLLLLVGVMFPGANATERLRSVIAGAIGTAVVLSAAFAASWQGLSLYDIGQTMRYLGIPLAWMLLTILGWRRFRIGFWCAAAAHGLAHLVVAYLTVKHSPVYWDNNLGWIGGDSRIFGKLFDAPNVIYAPTLSSAAFGAALAGAAYFLARTPIQRIASLGCTVAIVGVSVWLGNKASTFMVAGCWIIAYIVASRGTGSLMLKIAGVAAAGVLGLAAFSDRFADEGRAARLSGEFDPTFTGRTAIWADHIGDVWRYPFGVTLEKARDDIGMTEHNTPMQVARVFGWIPGGAYFIAWLMIGFRIFTLWSAGGGTRRAELGFWIAAAGPCAGISMVESLAVGSSGVFYGMAALTGIAIATIGVSDEVEDSKGFPKPVARDRTRIDRVPVGRASDLAPTVSVVR